jgi:dolichol-phosphate mannosyltransferase
MIAYTKAQIVNLLKIDFIRFCIVGGTGFTINLIFLVSLTKFFGLSTVVAQFIGAEIALFSNFLLHHHWTYKSHNVKKSFAALIIQFHATTWPAILGSTLMVSLSVSVLHLSKPVALIISSAISLLWNFFWSKYVVWRKVTDKEVTSANL